MENRRKISLIFLLLLIGGVKQYGQTLTPLNFSPVLNEFFNYSAGKKFITPGSPGISQLWNFSSFPANLWGDSYYIDINYQTQHFPSCTFVKMNPSGYFSTYFSQTDSTLRAEGHINNGHASYNHFPHLEMCYPLSLGKTCIDSVSGIYNYTMTADATGTLITPAGTYMNAIRVHSWLVQYNMVSERYTWYSPGIHDKIFTYFVKDSVGCFLYSNITSIGTIAKKHDIKIFPNPAFSVLNLDYDRLIGQANIKIKIINLLGQEIYCQVNTGSQIKIENLAKGIYYLKFFENEIEITTVKFLKN
jgi:hypothetical protein